MPPTNVAVVAILPSWAHTTDGLPIPKITDAGGVERYVIWYAWLNKHRFFIMPLEQAATRLGVRTVVHACLTRQHDT